MLTQQQFRLINFIHQKIQENGVSPSFEEMRLALDLKSKSGIHRLLQALEERGYLRRLANRARALDVVRLPRAIPDGTQHESPAHKSSVANISNLPNWARNLGDIAQLGRIKGRSKLAENDDDGDQTMVRLPLYGKIAAGTPITALQDNQNFINVPRNLISGRKTMTANNLINGDYYCLRVDGDSMIEAGIFNNDIIIIEKIDAVHDGQIAVALIDNEEATLKRVFARGENILLKPENRHYKEIELHNERVRIQGRLAGLMRIYHG